MPHPTAIASEPAGDEQLRLRIELSATLDGARTRLLDLPEIRPGMTERETTESATTLNQLADMVTHALELNSSLRTLHGLSTDSALVCGAVTVALSALADTISILRAELDSYLAA